MKALKILNIILFLFSIICHGQSFHSLPPGFNFQSRALFYDDSTNLLYVGGNFWALHDGTPMRAISVWNGNTWDSLGTGILGDVFSIIKYKGEIYAAGNFISAGGVLSKSIAKWNGNSWSTFGNINNSPSYSTVWNLNVFGNELYIMGNYDSINNSLADGISKFDGQNWTVYPPLDTIGYYNACVVFNNELYVGGNFHPGPGLQDIAKFDGTTWVSVGGGLSGPMSDISDMKVFQNKLYIVGNLSFSNGDHGNGIAVWDGSSWSQAGSGLLPGTIGALYEFQGELYAGGQIFNAGGVPVTYVAKWNGVNWSGLGGTLNNGVGSFASDGVDLYLGGGFTNISGDSMYYISRYSTMVGMNELLSFSENENRIFPNPASEYFVIEQMDNSVEMKVSIHDIAGRVIRTVTILPYEKQQVNVRNLLKGVYLVTIETSTKRESKKLIIDN